MSHSVPGHDLADVLSTPAGLVRAAEGDLRRDLGRRARTLWSEVAR
jgi:hypothetical protein